MVSTQIGRSYHIATNTVNAPLPTDASGASAVETSTEAFRLLIDVSKLIKTAGESLVSWRPIASSARPCPELTCVGPLQTRSTASTARPEAGRGSCSR